MDKLTGFLFVSVAGWLINLILLVSSVGGGTYLSSVHGDALNGVKRGAGFPADYAKGNCAHCHEQHASIQGVEPNPVGGASPWCLFANNFSGVSTAPYIQSDNVCFYCHYGAAGSYQSSSFSNYSYSITFGGEPTISPDSIFSAFNQASYHNLYDVRRVAYTLWPSTFTSSSNPCSACHNVHMVQKSCGKPGSSYDPTKAAISRPSQHGNLWGDDATERLNPNFTTNYQAPYWYNSTTTFEPAHNSTYDGTNLPDYNRFCIDCHNATNTIFSTTLGRNLNKIDWLTTGGDATGGDKHGINGATTYVCTKPPYNSSGACTSSFTARVLSCLDCHEPHGSSNAFLIRSTVNGGVLSGTIGSGVKDLGYLCRQCHMDDQGYNGRTNYWEYVHHIGGDYPYNQWSCGVCHGGPGNPPPPIRCSNCHYHGSYVTNARTPATRRTF